jgi:hypothetical protein
MWKATFGRTHTDHPSSTSSNSSMASKNFKLRFLPILKVFKNLRLPWLTEHVTKHDNNDVHLEIIIGEHPWDDQ